MKVVGVLAAIAVALWALHRLAVWAETRGWIYYRSRRGSSGTLGNAFLEMQQMIEPSKRIVLEERRREVHEENDEAGPPEAGGSGHDRPIGRS